MTCPFWLVLSVSCSLVPAFACKRRALPGCFINHAGNFKCSIIKGTCSCSHFPRIAMTAATPANPNNPAHAVRQYPKLIHIEQQNKREQLLVLTCMPSFASWSSSQRTFEHVPLSHIALDVPLFSLSLYPQSLCMSLFPSSLSFLRIVSGNNMSLFRFSLQYTLSIHFCFIILLENGVCSAVATCGMCVTAVNTEDE